MTDDVLFKMQATRDGVVTISRTPRPRPGESMERAVAEVLRNIADALESGATRLTEGQVS